MIICKIWDSEYPWDVRAEKVARALTGAGHEVHMVARNRNARPLVEQLSECTVHRLRPLPFMGRRLNAASMFPAFFNPRWKQKILKTARDTQADVLLVRDLPLAPTAVWAGRRLGIPVVLDMAENYPAMMRDIWEEGRQRPADWLIRNPGIVRRIERWTLARVDHTIVVVDESKARLIDLGVPADRITIVSNTPPVDRTGARKTPRVLQEAEALDVVYLGLLEVPRGIGTLVSAVDHCRQSGVRVRLTLIGDGRDREVFERQVRQLGLTDQDVRFLGYVANSDALKIVTSADVGVIPHHANESWNTTIPNKLFDYMCAGIAVVASNAVPVKRVVGETGSGIVFKDRDPVDLANALARLRDDQLRANCGRAGQDAVMSHYNWDQDSGRLLHALEQLAGTQPGPAVRAGR